MAKINQEEYKVLKAFDNKWKWIARTKEGAMKTFISKPFKNMDFGRSGSWDIKGNENHAIYTTYSDLFQFIQWEDEEPHNIAELIEEYEIENGMRYDFGKIKVVDIDTSKLATKNGFIYVKESEETEVKSKKELIEEWESAIEAAEFYGKGKEERLISYMKDFVSDLNQLDEPEVLSQEWIDEHITDGHNVNLGDKVVYADELDEVLVPKQELVEENKRLNGLLITMQEEVDQAYKDGYEKGKEYTFYKGYLEGLEDKGSEPETVSDVVADFYEACERLQGVMSMEVEELEE